MSETERLAEFAQSTEFDDIPSETISKAKTAIRDFLGVAIHGTTQGAGESTRTLVSAQYADHGATIVGGETASPAGAALANGTCGHAIDYDDTFESVSIHPTAPIFSAALAVGQQEDASGRAVLAAYVIGTEIAYAIEQGISPAHYQNGWHSTGTTASFGAVAAASSILDADREEIQRAFGTVASLSSANRKNFGSMTKPFHAGHAAHIGVIASTLSRDGFTADLNIFEGELGYGSVMVPGDAYDPAAILDSLESDSWAVDDIAFKPFPSGALTHAPMEVLLQLVKREDVDPDDVVGITVELDKTTEGVLHHHIPDTGLEAKFSMEFCLAVILANRQGTIAEFSDEGIQDPRIRAQLDKVERVYRETLFDGEYDRRGAIVHVELTDGTTLQGEERITPGGPTNPISEERLRNKYYRCVESVTTTETAAKLETSIEEMDESGFMIDTLADAFSY